MRGAGVRIFPSRRNCGRSTFTALAGHQESEDHLRSHTIARVVNVISVQSAKQGGHWV